MVAVDGWIEDDLTAGVVAVGGWVENHRTAGVVSWVEDDCTAAEIFGVRKFLPARKLTLVFELAT